VVKHSLIFAVFALIVVAASSLFMDQSATAGECESNYPHINQMLLESSRYTQTDESDPVVLDNYHNLYTLSYTDAELQTLGFEKMMQSDQLTIYFEKDSFSMIVKNETTGYFWSSRPEFQGMSGTRENNTANRNLMNSGLWVEYVRQANVSTSTIITSSLYTLADVSYQNNGSITETDPDHLRPYYLEDGSYSHADVTTTILSQDDAAFTVGVDLKKIGFSFSVTIALENDRIIVEVPQDSIVESGDVYRLLSIDLFPYFGAAREDVIPGYIVIPDGIGALVRTNQYYNTYFQSSFYGADYGYTTQVSAHLGLPIFGMVHEPGQNGYYVTIAEGSENATLVSNFWGASTRYDSIYAKYNLRKIYRRIINQAGDGSDTIAADMLSGDYQAIYTFLSDDDASYVGMAADYRDQLIASGVLNAREKDNGGNIPIQLDYIMSDQEPAIIGTSRVTMTSSSQIKSAYEEFKAAGIENQQLTVFGWSRDGFVNREPYNLNLIDKNSMKAFFAEVLSDGNTVYLYDDYVWTSDTSKRIMYNRDVAKSLSRLKLTYTNRSINGVLSDLSLVYPERSLAFAESDVDYFAALGISGMSLASLGSQLFSFYDGQNHSRTESIAYYQQLASLYDGLVLNTPNAYLFAWCDGYLSMPITNSQFDYYSDLVPLLPIILKGSVSYYTPYLNFNALAEDRLLTMIDFGINPSYILTAEETYKMRYTQASMFYSTTLSAYRDEIVSTYNYLNEPLKEVMGAFITGREVIRTGFVAIDYSNGVRIYVNYGYDAQTDDHFIIPARGYLVVKP